MLHDFRTRLVGHYLLGCGILSALCATVIAQQPPPAGGEVDDSHLTFSGRQRTRFESVYRQFRAGTRPNSEDQWLARTSLRGDFRGGRFGATLELMDGRAYHVKATGATNTGTVNTTDVINANATFTMNPFSSGTGRLLVGRYTMSVGSRRFVIRNGYRNTVNTFSGIDYLWNGDGGDELHAFWTMPVRRRPFDGPSLRDNDFEWDDQDKDLQFGGLFAARQLDETTKLEVFAYGLHEDAADSRNRRLLTPGTRLVRAAKPGRVSFEFEGALQVGDSQSTVGGAKLDHSAWFGHASVGYTGDLACQPSVRIAIDYASGDRDPTDGDNNQFDRLYGAPRFDFGPTSLWGVIQRSNFRAPELRVGVKPCARSSVMLAYRDLQLASSRDVWVGAGVRDASGQSGKQVGQHLEVRGRYEAIQKRMHIEVGAAYLFAGSFLDRAPNSQGGADSRYAYVQMTWLF
ncbi:MAG: hypothetical protein ACI89X_001663 [Planctomycetota bacterium]|jgi:hypothetical protein